MTKKFSTKKALITSVLSLMLCLSMLIGTTFAWFTDSVTSEGNIIMAGNLDVEMYWADGTEAPDSANWIDASAGAIFDYDNWEPGYVEVRHIKIVNEGDLALKYKVQIIANGEVTDLADVIDVYYVDPAIQVADREALANAPKLGTLTEVLAALDSTGNGALEPGNADTITIALKMQETAGNDYQGKSIGTSFSIQLLATQYDFESDSFGTDYDANLETEENGISRTLVDGSTVFYYNEESGYAGRARLVALPENLGSEYVVPVGVNDLGGVLAGKTLDKLTIPASVEYAYKSLEGATIGEVVIEDGTTAIPNRMFYKANVESVVIPEGVTVIEQNAFAQARGLTEIVIPASVTTIEEAAFTHADDLVTVTFEGNTSIQGYAFRGCDNLRTVVLEGDDVTFIASTLNGRNSTWFCNGESNNPNTSNITFYVENETVAARVRTAMGAEANNTKIYVDGKITVSVTTSEEFMEVLATAEAGTTIDATGVTLVPTGDLATTIAIPAGVSVKGATFAPSGECWLVIDEGDGAVAFEDCSFVGEVLSQFKIANKGCDEVTYTDCEFTSFIMINSTGNIDAVNTFDNCTFGLADGFMKTGYVNCMGGTSIFNQCTFNYAGGSTMGSNQYMQWNAVNSYSENSFTTYVELNGCVFNGCTTYRNHGNSTLIDR